MLLAALVVGIPSTRNNDVRDLTPNYRGMSQCGYRTCSTAGDGREALTQDLQLGRRSLPRCVCVCAGFGGNRQSAFFDVRVFNSLAPSNCQSSHTATYRHHETLKRRCYEQRIREIEHAYGLFTPLVFSATGCMAPAATIASLLAEKRNGNRTTAKQSVGSVAPSAILL